MFWLLAKARAPRKTAVFGSISDRPNGGDRKRYNAIARLALASADRVFFTGPDAARLRKLAAEEFAGRLFVVEKPEDVLRRLSEHAVAEELIYVKAAGSNQLQRIFVPRRNLVARWMRPS